MSAGGPREQTQIRSADASKPQSEGSGGDVRRQPRLWEITAQGITEIIVIPGFQTSAHLEDDPVPGRWATQ